MPNIRVAQAQIKGLSLFSHYNMPYSNSHPIRRPLNRPNKAEVMNTNLLIRDWHFLLLTLAVHLLLAASWNK